MGFGRMRRMIDWDAIDTVFLDMDGTLLDLRFDSYFWYQHLPKRFAQANGLEFQEAKDYLVERYRAMRGTLQWYCADYWSEQLDLDVVALKVEIRDQISQHPHAEEFLIRVKASQRPCHLVTNAHPSFVDLKLEESQLRKHFAHIVSSHTLKAPKESTEFWAALRKVVDYDPARTLMVDDDVNVLAHAAKAGIGSLVTVCRPDSGQPAREQVELGYPAIRDFTDIMPPSRASIS